MYVYTIMQLPSADYKVLCRSAKFFDEQKHKRYPRIAITNAVQWKHITVSGLHKKEDIMIN